MTTDNVTQLVRAPDGALIAAPAEDAQLKDALATVDQLREALASGRIKAFIAVGISPNHDTFAWCGKRAPFTILEAQGAWAALQGMLPEVL